jgi:hypothetical protein
VVYFYSRRSYLGKTTFHLAGLGDNGKVMLKTKFSQRELITFTANLGQWQRQKQIPFGDDNQRGKARHGNSNSNGGRRGRLRSINGNRHQRGGS